MMSAILWLVVIGISAAIAYFFVPNGESRIADSIALIAGLISFALSVKVLHIAHNTRQHILSKVAMGEIRELYVKFEKVDMSPPRMESTHIKEASEVIKTALACANSPDKQISNALNDCLSHLNENNPRYEIFIQKLGFVVKLLNLS